MKLEPIIKIEHYIFDIINGVNGGDLPAPVTRVEQYLYDIAKNQTSTLPPVTRIEHYLAKISGADVLLPTPESRVEKYLAVLAGMDVKKPFAPFYRIEYFLEDWIDNAPRLDRQRRAGDCGRF